MHINIPTKFYFINTFKKNNIDKLDVNTGVIFRNYSKKVSIYEIIKAKKYCKKKGIKFFLSNNIKLSIKLGLDGTYIPSFNNQINYIGSFSLPKAFKIIGSAHNLKEILIKKKQKCDEVFLSPLFKVDKSKKFLNFSKFNLIAINSKTSCIALGGINQSNYKKIKLLKSRGFATISWAKKNGLSELRPF